MASDSRGLSVTSFKKHLPKSICQKVSTSTSSINKHLTK
ncbi:hypothetical protein AOT82_1266 [Psychrobacter sp. AntiMn-1]|nr:hypothetical protein AOT82_1266 [Psychrobacter sp. AntiMn-1]